LFVSAISRAARAARARATDVAVVGPRRGLKKRVVVLKKRVVGRDHQRLRIFVPDD
jgi:hypothetical protein